LFFFYFCRPAVVARGRNTGARYGVDMKVERICFRLCALVQHQAVTKEVLRRVSEDEEDGLHLKGESPV
jgi:hypothetical protein